MLTPQNPDTPTSMANTYITAVDARARGALLGVSLPIDDAELEPLLFRSLQYIDSFEFKGEVVEGLQSTAFPRKAMIVNNHEHPSNIIPQPVIDAQIIAASESQSSALFINNTGQRIAEERVEGAVDVKYFNSDASGDIQSKLSIGRIDALLKPFLDDVDGDGFSDTNSKAYWGLNVAIAT